MFHFDNVSISSTALAVKNTAPPSPPSRTRASSFSCMPQSVPRKDVKKEEKGCRIWYPKHMECPRQGSFLNGGVFLSRNNYIEENSETDFTVFLYNLVLGPSISSCVNISFGPVTTCYLCLHSWNILYVLDGVNLYLLNNTCKFTGGMDEII
jgi:hypothetical protein